MIHQHVVEIDFKVDALRASLYKSAPDGTERSLGDLALEGFALEFAMEKYVMKVGVNLRYVVKTRTHESGADTRAALGLCQCM